MKEVISDNEMRRKPQYEQSKTLNEGGAAGRTIMQNREMDIKGRSGNCGCSPVQ